MTASILLALGLWSVGAYLLWTMRSNDLANALQASDNMAATMSGDIARNLDMFDLSLQAVTDNLQRPDVQSLGKDLRQLILFDRAATAKYLRSIKVLDANGTLILDSRTVSPQPKAFPSSDYFLVHQGNQNVGLYIGHPFFGNHGGYRIGVSRRLANADGSFGGVVVGSMELDYFKDMFAKVQMSSGSILSLVQSDGTLVMRNPLRRGDIGRDISRSELFNQVNNAPWGHFESVGKSDGISRLYTYLRVGDYPLWIVSGVSIDGALSGWRRNATAITAIFLALGLSTIAGAVFASRELRRRETAEARLRIMAHTDALTLIPNRRGFAAAIAREWNDAFVAAEPVALLMIDVDYFKAFNDEYGHQAGDEALITVGRLLDRARRSDRDIVARYGGEEFAMLLPGASAADAFRVAEGIRHSVGTLGRRDSGWALPTISVGVSSRTPPMPDAWDVLVAAADAALYKAKTDGRDRTVLDEALLHRAAKAAPLAA